MDTIRILRELATGMGGTVIAQGERSIGFSMKDGKRKSLLKLAAVGDRVILEQVSGPDKGKKAEVASLSEIRRAQESS